MVNFCCLQQMIFWSCIEACFGKNICCNACAGSENSAHEQRGRLFFAVGCVWKEGKPCKLECDKINNMCPETVHACHQVKYFFIGR